MTNIEKLARLIVKTGHADQIMSVLELALKIEAQPNDVGSNGSELCIREVFAGSDPTGLYQQAG
jgi:hypothetical protein